MFSILVSSNGLEWETENTMAMVLSRFNEYSGVEADSINVRQPETLVRLEEVDTLLMYEASATGPHVNVVRLGKINSIRAGSNKVAFRFKEIARCDRKLIEENAKLLDIDSFEFDRTHWAIKDGVIPKVVRDKMTNTEERYDIALSFAGEDRAFVEQVADYLKANDVAVFYDRFEEVELWGKDLAEHLDWVYRTGAQFCVMFISKHYAEKMWTNHERRSALAAAIQARKEYILPARFDSTELPGVRPTIGYVNLAGKTPEELGAMIVKKLGREPRRLLH